MKFLLLLICLPCFLITHAQEVFTFENQLNLVPEGIAIHPTNGTIFISSIAQKKIISIYKGKATDFIKPGQDHFQQGLGMKVDIKKSWLWALSNTRNGNQFTSHIHAFDLSTGTTKHHFTISDSTPRLYNDLLVKPSGELLITDTYSSSIYQYNPANKHLELLVFDTTKLKWPNGIDFLDANSIVLASYGNGILRIDLQSKDITPLTGYQDKPLAHGLDGLVLHGNNLYGIYNAGRGGYPSNAVVRYTLDDSRKHVISEQVIDRGNAAFADPTTAALYAGKLYVIANSHLDQFNANKESIIGIEDQLKPLKLVVYKL